MAKYIDKDALVAEIERLIKEHSSKYERGEAALVLDDLEDFIDTLEVKEADKDYLTWKDIERIDDISIRLDGTEETKDMTNKEFYQEVLKRFKAQKGE